MKYRALPPLSLEAAFNLHSVMRYQIEEGGEKKEGEREREREMGIVANLVPPLLAKKLILSSMHATIWLLALENCCFTG